MNEVKFNTQICTTREQSQRLLELGLNPETADMHWHYTNSRSESLKWRLEPYRLTTRGNFFGKIDRLAILQRKRTDGTPMTGDEVFEEIWGKDIPAWSLHRLIEMCNKTQFGVTISIYNNEVTVDGDLFEVFDNTYDNLISIIECLIKGGYFNKEYFNQ